jgi:phage-related protein
VRNVYWIKAALKDFAAFPAVVRDNVLFALDIVAVGAMPDIAKPLRGFAEGVFEIAISYRRDAWRVVYALKIDAHVWVPFQKKSKHRIKTPKHEIDLIRNRIRQLKELPK